jgi:hypothetical protein
MQPGNSMQCGVNAAGRLNSMLDAPNWVGYSGFRYGELSMDCHSTKEWMPE